MGESMQGMKRTHMCAEVTEKLVGQKVTLMGWVNKRRNLGQLIFIYEIFIFFSLNIISSLKSFI